MAKEHGRGVQYSNFERQLRMNIRMNLPSLLSHCCLNMCNAYIYIYITHHFQMKSHWKSMSLRKRLATCELTVLLFFPFAVFVPFSGFIPTKRLENYTLVKNLVIHTD